jgi:tetratricopeptide (TPR) repeat protein
MNRLESAIAVFEKSVILNPKDSGAFYNLACAQALSGKDELAINALEKAIAMSPELSIDALRDKIFEGFKSSLRFQTIIESAISH